MNRTAFHDVNLEYGAQMREMFGYYLPWEYAPGQVTEHLGTRQRASLCDLDYMGVSSIEGPGALAFAQQLLTNDFRRQPVGAFRYTAMCDARGNMVDDGTLWRIAEDRYMFVSGDEADYDWLTQNAGGCDVDLKNITREVATLALQGPQSQQILSRLTDADLGAIRYYHFRPAAVDGVQCLVARMGYTGEFGFELHFHPQYARQLWIALMKAGEEFGIVPLGQAALESLRQEAGYILVGNDHDKSTNPLEAGIGWTVKFDKPDFNGKAALSEIARGGVMRRLVWLKVRDGSVANKGDPILIGENKVGVVTSGSYSPTFRAGTAMGYVLPQYVIPGIDFVIKTGGKPSAATLSVVPLYDPGDWLTKRHL
jgi:aminomethyltransferase